MINKYIYTVWVGGSEVNDTYLTRREAINVAKIWIGGDSCYDDVIIQQLYLYESKRTNNKIINTLNEILESGE